MYTLRVPTQARRSDLFERDYKTHTYNADVCMYSSATCIRYTYPLSTYPFALRPVVVIQGDLFERDYKKGEYDKAALVRA